MDIRLNKSRIFLAMIMITLIAILVMAAEAKEQDSKFYSDYVGFCQATELMRQGDFDQAQTIMGNLLSKYESSFQIYYYYGVCLSEQNEYKEAAVYLLKAQKLRPALLGEQGYLYTYGKVLHELEDIEAEHYLQGSIKYGKNKEMSRTAQEMLNDMHTKNSDRG